MDRCSNCIDNYVEEVDCDPYKNCILPDLDDVDLAKLRVKSGSGSYVEVPLPKMGVSVPVRVITKKGLEEIYSRHLRSSGKY